MKQIFIFLIGLFFLSCNVTESYKVCSPKGNKCLLFQWHHNLFMDSYITISIPGRDDASISIRQFMDFPILINWADTIKIRGGIYIEENNQSSLIDWKFDQTLEEQIRINSDTINWKSYYLNKIPLGYYQNIGL